MKPASNRKINIHVAYVRFCIGSLPEDELENVRKNVSHLKSSLALYLEEAFWTQAVLSQVGQQMVAFLVGRPLPSFSTALGTHWQGPCLRLLLTQRDLFHHPKLPVTRGMQM